MVEADGDGALIHVHVQPRAGRTELVGRHADALKVRVSAPPVDGRATDATVRVLAAALGVAPSRVVLASGAQSRMKRFRVAGLSAAVAAARLEAALGEGARRRAVVATIRRPAGLDAGRAAGAEERDDR